MLMRDKLEISPDLGKLEIKFPVRENKRNQGDHGIMQLNTNESTLAKHCEDLGDLGKYISYQFFSSFFSSFVCKQFC